MENNHSFIAINSANFESEVVQATEPVVLEFWTEGCKPCRKLGGSIRKYAGQLKIAPCNVDENPELASQFSVHVIPTLLFFKNGEVVDQAMGTFNDINEAEVEAKCRSLIAA
jgi:thioredoxin 1